MVFTIIHFKFLNKLSGLFGYNRYDEFVVVFKLIGSAALCLKLKFSVEAVEDLRNVNKEIVR